ncbi:MAG TPA: amidohydrolase family protein [Acidimicrobiales bacterium]|nr:amidohydrolase family protein [Acidimicrobiales bacterium]
MSDPRVVDVHVHLFEQPDDPVRDGYEIWEYGSHDGVEFGTRRGTPEDLVAALGRGEPVAHSVLLGMFCPQPAATGEADRLRDYNGWVLETAATSPHLTPFVAADPGALGGRAGAAHLRWAAERGAKGIKLHPPMQSFAPDDPRLDAIYETCLELGLSVLAHSGSTRHGPAADPFAFSAVLEAHPGLHLVLAHLGGASWRQVTPFAAAYPSVSFDLCEIIAWTGAPHAPTADELGVLIRNVGPERVLFGTDFPWYELDRTIEHLMSLPHLSDEERLGILGENAISRIGLDLS